MTTTFLIIWIVFDCVYTTVSLIVFVLTSLLVLRHLSKRRNYVLANAVSNANVSRETTLKMWLKHPDFHFSPLLYSLAMAPRFHFYTFLNYNAVANSGPLAWFDVFQLSLRTQRIPSRFSYTSCHQQCIWGSFGRDPLSDSHWFGWSNDVCTKLATADVNSEGTQRFLSRDAYSLNYSVLLLF